MNKDDAVLLLEKEKLKKECTNIEIITNSEKKMLII